jgi:hypothetical protein
MKKIVRLTESDLVKIVKKIINEQNDQKNYQQMSEKLFNALKGFDYEFSIFSGLNNTQKEKEIIEIIKQINTEEEWKKLQDTFGKKRGRTLQQWLEGDLSDFQLRKVLTSLNQRIDKNKANITSL